MSESNNDNFYIETYVKKQEALLLEHIRRQIQAEAKNSVIEMLLAERNSKVTELEDQLNQLKTAVNQSLNGLKSITFERDSLNTNLKEANDRIEYLNKFKQSFNDLQAMTLERDRLQANLNEANDRIEYLGKFQTKYNVIENDLANKTVAVDSLSTKMKTSQLDLEQMKENYNIVTTALDDATTKLSKLSKIKNNKKDQEVVKKVAVPANSEWVDGD